MESINQHVVSYSLKKSVIDDNSTIDTLVNEIEEYCISTDKKELCCFIAEQLKLSTCNSNNGRRYSTDMLLFAFKLYHIASKCYEQLREPTIVPNVTLPQIYV